MCLPVSPFKIEKEWVHNGLICAITLASELGTRCGYVRLPPSHALYNVEYEDDRMKSIKAHGGITFGKLEECTDHKDGVGYWIGIDFADYGDKLFHPDFKNFDKINQRLLSRLKFLNMMRAIAENRPLIINEDDEHYWTHDEVVREVEQLAEQL